MSSRGLAFRLAGVSSLVLALALTGAARAQDAALTPAPELHDFVAPLPPDVEARFEDVTRQPQTIADIQTLMPSLPPEAVARFDDVEQATDRKVADVVVPLPPEAVASFDDVKDAARALADAPVLRLDIETPPAIVADFSDVLRDQQVVAGVRSALAAMGEAEILKGSFASSIRRERAAVSAFYEARGFAPVWIDNGKWTPQAAAAIARLERAGDDGLNLVAYRIPTLSASDPVGMANADVALSQAVVAYGRQASGGRLDPRSIASTITAKPEVADAAVILADVAKASDAGAALRAFNPSHKGYLDLRTKLAELRREQPSMPAQVRIPSGPILKIGMKDPRVPLIRSRLGIDTAQALNVSEDLVYDNRVATAVKDFQREQGLPVSGTLTARTIAALSGGEPTQLEGEIVANMERWRWLPRDMGPDRIEVNIPDYALKLSRGGEVVHRTRVVVGKAQTPTPVFSDTMRFLIVNPYWNVPPSIIKNEMMPKLAADPGYLARQGYEVIQKKGQIFVRQPPGDRNALGHIKFMFPNEHSVYLHDTPSRHLFANAKRAYSHGCVRVENPFALAEVILGRQNGWSQERLKKMVGGGEKTVNLPQTLPVHIQYFTALVDEAGKLQLREDIYGYSRKMRAALGFEG